MSQFNNSLQENFDKTIRKLESMNNISPNLATFWKNYLIIKKHDLEKEIIKCDKLFTNIEEENIDIPISTIIMLSNIYNA
jgi:hypothetical protein|tara:strand:+ start:2041 stop:2280 length:240 start_codon:yes stop_codon:yes gene_type:complete